MNPFRCCASGGFGDAPNRLQACNAGTRIAHGSGSADRQMVDSRSPAGPRPACLLCDASG
jgi:hypothetical protein